MNQRTIEVVPYNPDWPKTFQQEAVLLKSNLGDNCISIDHIGSTSVPNLAAKPIIDILITVNSLDLLDSKNSAMKSFGYECKGENGIAGRRYFQKLTINNPNNRTHHIHAFKIGSPDITRHLAFRDYLIAHPDKASKYSAVKLAAAAKCQNSSEVYMALKNDFIQAHEKLALQWIRA